MPLIMDGWSSAEWQKIQSFSPLPALPPDTTNRWADNEQAARLGQRIYFDKGFSGPIVVGDDGHNGGIGQAGETGKANCATCHNPAGGWWDDHHRSQPDQTSLGLNWTSRHDPALVNAAFYDWFGWGGAADTGWSQALSPLEFSLGSSRLALAHYLYKNYKAEYDALFPVPLDPALDPAAQDAARFPAAGRPKSSATAPDGAWERMAPADQQIVNTIFANLGKAVAAYVRKLISRNAPFDQYVAGKTDALTAQQKRGLALFVGKAACDVCHRGPFFTDQGFHNLGVPQMGEHVPAMDAGRQGDLTRFMTSPFRSDGAFSDDPVAGKQRWAGVAAPALADLGKFRTKNLRNVAEVGPYMHDGVLPTLNDVVAFYNAGGGTGNYQGTKDPLIVPLNLTTDEMADLVAFLTSLTGDPVPDSLKAPPAMQ